MIFLRSYLNLKESCLGLAMHLGSGWAQMVCMEPDSCVRPSFRRMSCCCLKFSLIALLPVVQFLPSLNGERYLGTQIAPVVGGKYYNFGAAYII